MTDLVNLDEVVRSSWKDVFERDDIEAEHDFFELGGDSFLATLVVGALSEELNIDLAVTDIYAHSTMRGFIDYVRGLIHSE